jgi:tetratricopeptide (TPR) repeat protein
VIKYFSEQIQSWDGKIASCAEKLEIFHHLCEQGEYQLAYRVMAGCVDRLDRAGYYQELIKIYERLTREWRQPANDDESRNLGWAWTRLGNLDRNIGQIQLVITAHGKAQELFDRLNFAEGKAASLGNLGNAYDSLGEFQRAIDFHQQHQDIAREIGDRNGVATSLFNQAFALAKYETQRLEVIDNLHQARSIFLELGLTHDVEDCDNAIHNFNQIIATESQLRAPAIEAPRPAKPDWWENSLPAKEKLTTTTTSQQWWLWFAAGLAIALIIWWWKK